MVGIEDSGPMGCQEGKSESAPGTTLYSVANSRGAWRIPEISASTSHWWKVGSIVSSAEVCSAIHEARRPSP